MSGNPSEEKSKGQSALPESEGGVMRIFNFLKSEAARLRENFRGKEGLPSTPVVSNASKEGSALAPAVAPVATPNAGVPAVNMSAPEQPPVTVDSGASQISDVDKFKAAIAYMGEGARLEIKDENFSSDVLKTNIVDALLQNDNFYLGLDSDARRANAVESVENYIVPAVIAAIKAKDPGFAEGKPVRARVEFKHGTINVELFPAAVQTAVEALKNADAVVSAAADAVFNCYGFKSAMNGFMTSTTYVGIEGSLRSHLATIGGKERIGSTVLGAGEGWTKFVPTTPGIFPENYFPQLFDKLSGKFMSQIDDKLRARIGVDYSSDVAKKVGSTLTVEFKNGNMEITNFGDFDEKYRVERSTVAVDGEQNKVKELDGFLINTLLEFCGATDGKSMIAMKLKIVRGEHWLSPFFGAISASSGGKAFAWALPSWNKTKGTLSKNEKFAQVVPLIEGTAATVGGFVVSNEVSKDNAGKNPGSWLTGMMKAGKGSYIVDDKGLVLTDDVPRKAKIIVGTVPVELPKGTLAYAETDSELKGSPVGGGNLQELPQGTYYLAGLQKDMYFPPGTVVADATAPKEGDEDTPDDTDTSGSGTASTTSGA